MSNGLISKDTSSGILIGNAGNRQTAVHHMKAASVANTFTCSCSAHRQFDPDGLVRKDLKEVDVNDAVGDRVELDVLNNAVVGRASNFKVQPGTFPG